MSDASGKPCCLCLHSKAISRIDNYEVIFSEYCRTFFGDFETVGLDMNCDLKEEIEKHSPSLIAYANCFYEELECKDPLRCPKNAEVYPEIPRIGVLGFDKYSPGNYAAYQMLRKLGCKVCVSSLSVNGELLFESDDMPVLYRFQSCPGSVFRDYGEEKSIPVGLFGRGFMRENAINKNYPWRKRVVAKSLDRVPLFHAPAPTGISTIKGAHDISGEKYARMLNRCRVALTCGTEQNNFLQKHFEIPACRTCMITEESNIVKEYGFRDMENCVFADEDNICERLEYLFTNPEKLQEITDAGYELVQKYINPQNKFNIITERSSKTPPA